jgi:Cytochrome bd terminal oxidase subunit I
MFNPATPPQTTHMILAAFMVAGFGTAAVYAAAILRGRTDRYHRLGFVLPFAMAAVLTPVQIGVGDWAARFLADNQPVKLAALEGLNETRTQAPLTIGGVYVDGEVRYGLEVPGALSLLAYHDRDAVVAGLEEVPAGERPPVAVVRTAFQVMVAIGTGLLFLAGWFGVVWWRRRRLPRARLFLWGGTGSRAACGRRARGGLGCHGGGPPAVDRLRGHARRRCRDPGSRDPGGVLRVDRRLRRPHRRDRRCPSPDCPIGVADRTGARSRAPEVG